MRSSFTKRIDAQTWLQAVQASPISVEIPNTVIVPGNDRNAIWASDRTPVADRPVLVDGSGASPEKLTDLSTGPAIEEVAKLLPLKSFGKGPVLDESKVHNPDRAYTTDLRPKAEFLVGLVNTDSKNFAAQLRSALLAASDGSLTAVLDQSTSHSTLTLQPGSAIVEEKQTFQLQADSGETTTLTCSYTLEVPTTGSLQELEGRIASSRGTLKIEATPFEQKPVANTVQKITDPRLTPSYELQDDGTLNLPQAETLDWSQPDAGIESLSVNQASQKAFNLAYQVYVLGGPATDEGKQALLQLSHVCASNRKEFAEYADQVPDPLDALRAVEVDAHTDGLSLFSLQSAYDVIQGALSGQSGELIRYVFGEGAAGSPFSDALREQWRQGLNTASKR